jgi:hypothetical protein
VEAPEGYVLAGHEQTEAGGYNPGGSTTLNPSAPVFIEFGGGTPVYLPDGDVDVIEVVQYNEQQKGKVNIEKKGERPVAVTTDSNGNLVFAYKEVPLSGVVFHIIADGDILSQDGNGTVLFRAGDIVAELETDKDGKAWADNLPIGSYILREIKAPVGFVFVDDEYFAITAIEQEKQFTFLSWNLTDERQRLNIQIIKTKKGSGAALKGAEFSLYAAEDIVFGDTGIVDPDFFDKLKELFTGSSPFNVIEKDTLIAVAVSGADGKAIFEDLPPGRYYVKETKAPKGYKLNRNWIAEFTLEYTGHTTKVITYSETCVNEPSGGGGTPAPNQPKGSVPKTGDENNPFRWLIISLAAAAGITTICIWHRRKGKGDIPPG